MKKLLYGSLVAIVILAAVFFYAKGQSCVTQTTSGIVGYAGVNDDTIENKQSVTHDTGLQLLRLSQQGANFVASSGYPITTNYRMSAAAGDFNMDGKSDLAEGGRDCDNHNYEAGDTNLAIFLSEGDDPAAPTRFKFSTKTYINYLSTFTTYEMMALGAGDFDKDGEADVAALSWAGKLWIFKNNFKENGHYIPNSPTQPYVVDFNATPTLIGNLVNDGYGEFGSGGNGYRWESNIAVADVNGDGWLDLLVAVPTYKAFGRYGEVVVYINNKTTNPIGFSRTSQTINPFPNNVNTFQYGACGIAAGKFITNGYVDFIVGSAGSGSNTPRDMYYYKNDGTGRFTLDNTRTITIANHKGSVSTLGGGDLDGDGKPDFVLSTDGAHSGYNYGGFVYWYKNAGTGVFTANCVSSPPNCDTPTSSSKDLDAGAVGDFNNDGALDFFVADGNDSQKCFFFRNTLTPTYFPEGSVYSKNLLPCDFVISDNAVVAATIHVTENKPSGTDIIYYLSNSDDASGNPQWEGPVTPNVEFLFQNPGNFLRWKAVFTTSIETNTPKLYLLTLDYRYITKREYSRTSHAITTADVNSDGKDEEVLYAAAFEFPKWRGHLRSWNVTNLTLANNKFSQLAEIGAVGATPVLDAGLVLKNRAWNTRIVYTSYDPNGDDVMNGRLLFGIPHDVKLDEYLNIGMGSPEIEPLIKFVLGEVDPSDPKDHRDDWKLGDINHSSPQALEPPSGTPALMGTGYDAFKTANANRRKAILVGANDGMLHCFDPVTMDELWAFIPNNLLYKLQYMRITDPNCGEYLMHQFFVDGTPVIRDVYINGAWKTVVVCGQGAGWGKNHTWYYFCLDVTDPLNPLPMWEFTEAHIGETWSVPAIGKVKGSPDMWVAFFGSGYDALADVKNPLGNYFYAVDIATGQSVATFLIQKNPETSPFSIQNTLPGSPDLADPNKDGYVESVYFGDLLGRLWKIDLTPAPASWNPAIIYEDPDKYPIITKPVVYISPADSSVHLHFGTGGDEKATALMYYSVVALKDVSPLTVDWYLGPADLAGKLGIDPNLKKGALAQGEKVWADPVISDKICYIATLNGSIEGINPCKTLEGGGGKIYARHLEGALAGASALVGASGVIENLETAQKVRSAVTIGKTQKAGDTDKRKVFIQTYTQPAGSGEPPSQVLAQPVPANKLTVKSWREIYKIIK